jgi:hypothetical protein
MDSVAQWEALRALKAALEAAEVPTPVGAPTPERAMAWVAIVTATIDPAFHNAVGAGVPLEEAMDVFGPGAGAAIEDLMGTMVASLASLDRAAPGARRAAAADADLRVRSALPVNAGVRRAALRELKIVAEAARVDASRSQVTTLVPAVRNAVKAGVPLAVALEVLGREGVPLTTALGGAMTDSRAQAADAEARVRPAIPLPELVPDHSASVVPAADAHVRPASPSPESVPGPSDSEADLRTIDGAATVLSATLTQAERHIAAGALNQFRSIAGRTTERAQRLRRTLGGARIRRRPRASRAPRRAAHRSAVAPARDGPPPSDGPAPVASRSLRGVIGGAR